jgi:Icc-related predicted phosphoesterase
LFQTKVLSLSDVELDLIYSPAIRTRFKDIDLLLSCGDLPYFYLEYVISSLNRPLFFVRGNHSQTLEFSGSGPRKAPEGGEDLHRRVVVHNGLILAGVEGSLRYRQGPFQYSQAEMWWHVIRLIPAFLRNRVSYGRYVDVFVSHAPPWGIHDQPDLPHQGIKAFRWLIEVFRPAYHFHGHIHLYRHDVERLTHYRDTVVMNSYGYVEATIRTSESGWTPLRRQKTNG